MNWTRKIKRPKSWLIYRPAGGGTIEIFDIHVGSERGIGTGTAMLEELLEKEEPQRVVAITRMSNILAQKFYKKNHFDRVVLPSFYPDESAVMYILCV